MRIRFVCAGFVVIVAAAPAPVTAQSAIDTLVAVDPDTRLEVQQIHGDVTIGTWGRSAVRVVANVTERNRVRIRRNVSVLAIQDERPHGTPVDYTLTVPAAMDLVIHGVDTDITIVDTEGRVDAQTVKGDIHVRGGRTVIELGSVQGKVDLTGARGSIEVQSVNQGVVVSGASGDVKASTVNGPIGLSRITSKSVEGTSVNGGIRYDGTLSSDGWYRFSTHNGGIAVVVPPGTGAIVEVSTFNGSLSASFPVSVGGLPVAGKPRDKQFRFTLGSGGARISLESFNGSIRLVRSGEK
ncbi:MAG: hypothetical protein H0W36_02565 [Gemmatimonadetes bacterium]|nr:hypothetical protein [Gemmatimonadota bacterium]